MKKISYLLSVLCFAQLGMAQNYSCGDLIEAIEDENQSEVIILLAYVDPNCTQMMEGTPLVAAVRSENMEVVKLLVAKGADVNFGLKGDGTPLIEAARMGQLRMVRYLLDQNADVNVYLESDETPLIQAAWNGHLAVVQYLVDHGAEVNKTVRDRYRLVSEKRNALRMAKREGHRAVVDYLITKGAKQ